MNRTEYAAQPPEPRTLHPEGRPFSMSTYTNWRCRCGDCRLAWAEYTSGRKSQREVEAVTAGTSGTHPAKRAVNENTYTNWGCRCDGCTADHAAKARARRKIRASV